MDITLLYKSVIFAGLIVVFLAEIVKRHLKKSKGTEDSVWQIPTWLGMSLGSGFSLIVSFIFFMAWIHPRTVWVFLILSISVFLFQYFVSMEIAKKLLALLSKREGFDLDSIIEGRP